MDLAKSRDAKLRLFSLYDLLIEQMQRQVSELEVAKQNAMGAQQRCVAKLQDEQWSMLRDGGQLSQRLLEIEETVERLTKALTSIKIDLVRAERVKERLAKQIKQFGDRIESDATEELIGEWTSVSTFRNQFHTRAPA
jgi:chromosome segregation ATPase